MKVIEASVELVEDLNPVEIMKKIERAGRVCYKSEKNINDTSAEKFIRGIIKRGHESVIEHVSITFKLICDRGVTHELVRHRLASYSQESTRYCDYSGGIIFIKPCFWSETDPSYKLWLTLMEQIEKIYRSLRKNGVCPEEARTILPNSLKTEIFVTMNLREWRHFLKLRTSKRAHPQMREIALKVYKVFLEKLPIIFDDIKIED